VVEDQERIRIIIMGIATPSEAVAATTDKSDERREKFRKRKEQEAEEELAKEREELRKKEARRLAEYGSEKKRTQRAYGWYTKLAFPSKEEMRKKVALIKDVDISVDDIDLLPWTASCKRVDVVKMNRVLFAAK
jgi:hypothetical protein